MRSQDSETEAKWRAVLLDYGEVLCHRPSPDEFMRMAKIFALPLESFLPLWDKSRALIDNGTLTPEEYWAKFASDTNVSMTPEQVETLCRWEIEMWSNANTAMVDWLHQLSDAKIKIGLLSNMPLDLAAHVQTFPWMKKFDSKTFSSHVALLKPDPSIYEHALRGLEVEAAKTIFVDDRQPNVDAARKLGLQAIRFLSVEQLRGELEIMGFPILPKPSV